MYQTLSCDQGLNFLTAITLRYASISFIQRVLSAFPDLLDEEKDTHGGLPTIQSVSSNLSISVTSEEFSDQKSRTFFVVSLSP
jgi:hypothetical protein